MTSGRDIVLVVDSNAANRSLLAQQLDQLGFEAVLAEDGRQALDLLATRRFQIVLLSIGLWGVNSYQVLERMTAGGLLASTPVIMLTPQDQTPGIERSLALGASDYLPEPFLPVVLKQRMLSCYAQRQLQEARRDLAAREELMKIERDVQIARQIQLGFLPDKLPQLPGWEIAASFRPAREVAGDFYDAFMLTQNRRLGLVIADVADKGVGAALFMSLARSLIRAFGQQNHSVGWMDVLADAPAPGERRARLPGRQSSPSIGTTALRTAMQLTNSYITTNHLEMNMFVTLFFGVLDPITGALIYVNGGHVPPVIVGAGGIKDTLTMTGPAVGLFPDAEFEIKHAQLDPGETLFCYTDGVTDARDPSGAFFRQKRVTHLLEQPPASAAALLRLVETNVQAHIADAAQFDDITMLGVRRAALDTQA